MEAVEWQNTAYSGEYMYTWNIRSVNPGDHLLLKNGHAKVTLLLRDGIHVIPGDSLVLILRGTVTVPDGQADIEIIRIPADWVMYCYRLFSSVILSTDRSTGNKNFFIKKNAGRDERLLFDSVRLHSVRWQKREMASLSYSLKLASLLTSFGEEAITEIFSTSVISFSERVKSLITGDISRHWRLSDISKKFFVSEVCLRKKMASEGTCFTRVLLESRMEKALDLLLSTDKSISYISEEIGYKSRSYFVQNFKKFYGYTPLQYRHLNKR
ncbi:TPA: helix-turn-helix domain-containing protein [Escherichia coli]|nr:helix-turn-helix domain-containing protein [Escherichia coli]